jgi:hypothetical protein
MRLTVLKKYLYSKLSDKDPLNWCVCKLIEFDQLNPYNLYKESSLNMFE